MKTKDYSFDTKLIHPGSEMDPFTGAVSVPIYQVSTFDQGNLQNPREFDYSRSGNPTRKALEQMAAVLENGSEGFAFSSGMAAIHGALSVLNAGDHILVCEDVYGGTYRILTRYFTKFGIETTFVDVTKLENIEENVKNNTKALFLESPSNPLLKITDIEAACHIGKKYGLINIVDNTFMTPYYQNPLDLGADIVVHSATKFLGGHSDVVAGLVIVKDKSLGKEIRFTQNAVGAVLGPQDSWLLMRGMKTLKVRMDHQSQSAYKLACWLREHEKIEKVYYPGFDNHPGYEIHRKQSRGDGAIVSFLLRDYDTTKKVLSSIEIPVVAVSLGAVESILTYPTTMSHAAMPKEQRLALGVTDNLLRISVGLENVDELIADFERVLS